MVIVWQVCNIQFHYEAHHKEIWHVYGQMNLYIGWIKMISESQEILCNIN
jgi:hypothetical protein